MCKARTRELGRGGSRSLWPEGTVPQLGGRGGGTADRWAFALAVPPHEGTHPVSLVRPPCSGAHSDRHGVSRGTHTPLGAALSSRSLWCHD